MEDRRTRIERRIVALVLLCLPLAFPTLQAHPSNMAFFVGLAGFALVFTILAFTLPRALRETPERAIRWRRTTWEVSPFVFCGVLTPIASRWGIPYVVHSVPLTIAGVVAVIAMNIGFVSLAVHLLRRLPASARVGNDDGVL